MKKKEEQVKTKRIDDVTKDLNWSGEIVDEMGVKGLRLAEEMLQDKSSGGQYARSTAKTF